MALLIIKIKWTNCSGKRFTYKWEPQSGLWYDDETSFSSGCEQSTPKILGGWRLPPLASPWQFHWLYRQLSVMRQHCGKQTASAVSIYFYKWLDMASHMFRVWKTNGQMTSYARLGKYFFFSQQERLSLLWFLFSCLTSWPFFCPVSQGIPRVHGQADVCFVHPREGRGRLQLPRWVLEVPWHQRRLAHTLAFSLVHRYVSLVSG